MGTIAQVGSEKTNLVLGSFRCGLLAGVFPRTRPFTCSAIFNVLILLLLILQSLNTGRPPSFSLAYIDCSFPQYDHKDKDANNSACASHPVPF